ncbi:MAG: rhodanese-like domain-containing protein [Planctomycetota bacterium]
MIRSIVRLTILVVLSAAAGIGYARYRGMPLFPDSEERAEHERWMARTAISLEEFIDHYEMGGLVIDARPREVFEEGHLDAILVMNIPADEAADGFQIDRVLSYLGEQVVMYCASETCESVELLWRVLQPYGFGEEMRIYHPGWSGIEEAGLPTIDGPDLLANGSTDSHMDDDADEGEMVEGFDDGGED